jgi:hypothetical protein
MLRLLWSDYQLIYEATGNSHVHRDEYRAVRSITAILLWSASESSVSSVVGTAAFGYVPILK